MTSSKNISYLYNIKEESSYPDEEPLSSSMSNPPFMSHIISSSFDNQPDSPTSSEDMMMRQTPPSSPELSPVSTPTPKRKKRVLSINEGSSPPLLTSTPSKRTRTPGPAKCSNCAAEQTPLWRKGADGKTLCNKCGLYWSRHSKHRPVKLDRSQTTGGGTQPSPIQRKQSLPNMKTSAPISLKSKKLESPLKRTFSYEEQGMFDDDDHQTKRKKIKNETSSSPITRRRKKQMPIIEEYSSSDHSSVSYSEEEHSSDAEAAQLHFNMTPQSASVTAIQNQLAAFDMQQQQQPISASSSSTTISSGGHSSENEFKVTQEQVIADSSDAFSNNSSTGGVSSTDPFLAQLLTNSSVDPSSYYHQYLQTQVLDAGSVMQYQQQSQPIVHAAPLQLAVQPQRFYDQHQLQVAFNDNANIHSPCGDNLDSLFSSLFGNSGLVSSCSANTVNSSNGPQYECIPTDNNSAFLGSPFL